MPDLNVRPDEDMLHQAETYYTELWGNCHQKWTDIESFYWREFSVWPESVRNREVYKPSTAASVIDHAVDNQLAFEPSVHCPVFEPGEEAEARSSLRETWLTEVLKASALLEPSNTWKQLGKHFLIYGYTVLEGPIVDFTDRPPAEPKKRDGESDEEFDDRKKLWTALRRNYNPFRYRAPHPGHVLLDPRLKQPREAIKTIMRTARDVNALSISKAKTRKYAQVWDIPSGTKPFDMVETKEYWNAAWHAVYIKGQILFVEANPWGFVPFTHAFSGFGNERFTTQAFDPAYLAVGLLDHIRDSLRVQAQNFSARHELLMKAAYAPMGTRLPAEEVAAKEAEGGYIEGEPDDIWVMRTNEVSRWMMEVGAEVDRDIDKGSYSEVLGGRRPAGVSTVGQQQIMTSQAIKKFQDPAKQLEQIVTIAGQNTLRLAEVLNRDYMGFDEITVGGASLRPSQIRHNYNVQVKFELIDPVIDLQRQQMGMQMVGQGLISDETFRANYARLEDESGERKRLIKQWIRKHPAVLEAAGLAVAQEEGQDKILADFQEQQRNAQPVPSGNGSAPQAQLREPLTGDTVRPPQEPGAFDPGIM